MRLMQTISSLVLLASGAVAQTPIGTLLTIVTEHQTAYRRDVTDYSLLASQPGPTNVVGAQRTFGETILIGDIVSVNGRPAKGTQTIIVTILGMGPNPAPAKPSPMSPARRGPNGISISSMKADGRLAPSGRAA